MEATNQKVTVYYNSGLCGMGKIEGRLEAFSRSENQPQHGSVRVVRKRCRKATWLDTIYQPYILVVLGWGHPDPPESFEPIEQGSGWTVHQGKYSSCDPAIEADFHAAIEIDSADVVFEVGR